MCEFLNNFFFEKGLTMGIYYSVLKINLVYDLLKALLSLKMKLTSLLLVEKI